MPRNAKRLPFCSYPTADDIDLHGLQTLPADLPIVNLEQAKEFRSGHVVPIAFSELSLNEMDQCARLLADSFAENEPMNKHLIVSDAEPAFIRGMTYEDIFGDSAFGPISLANVVYWFIRIFMFTTEVESGEQRKLNKNMMKHSFAFKDESGEIIGVSLGRIVEKKETTSNQSHPFMDYVNMVKAPILKVLREQYEGAFQGLHRNLPGFSDAIASDKVGAASMIAKNHKLPSEGAFEMFATVVENFRNLNFEYVITVAANQWTGAAAEVFNGTRVYFHPYRVHKIEATAFSNTPDGFISYKDSGIMFYIMKLL